MNKSLRARDIFLLAGLVFGLFFGSGNLIFPVYMGQNAGYNSFTAFLGFIITAVGLPMLGIIALGVTGLSGTFEAASRFKKRFAIILSTSLYLIIGPLVIVPRNGATSYDICFSSFSGSFNFRQIIFYLIFFLLVLLFSIKQSKVYFWITKVLNPLLLFLLAILFARSLLSPMADLSDVIVSTSNYASAPFLTGFLDGYNTCDALGSMISGLLVIQTIKSLGINDQKEINRSLFRVCGLAALLLITIYGLCVYLGTTSLAANGTLENGNQILLVSAYHYFGKYGYFIIAGITCLACLKTAVGCMSSVTNGMLEIYPKGFSYNKIIIIFSIISFIIANIGLNNIVALSSPILNFYYPVIMVLIILTLLSSKFYIGPEVYFWIYVLIFIPMFIYSLSLLPTSLINSLHLNGIIEFGYNYIPLFKYSFGWLIPAIIGFIIGLIRSKIKKSD